MDEENLIDIGNDHFMKWYRWAPDRKLNPQYDDVPDVEKFSLVVVHKNKLTGEWCKSALPVDGPVQRIVAPFDKHRWQVVQEEPLTLSPSLLCTICGDHGHIVNGRWVGC